MRYAIGVDPGKSGAMVVLDGKDKYMLVTPVTDKEIDIVAISEFLFRFCDDAYCVLEDVHSIFGSSAASNFQFGRALGIVEGIISTLGIPVTKVAPKKWQKAMWEGVSPVTINTGKLTKDGNPKYKVDTKKTSLIAAGRIFSGEKFLESPRCRTPHDGLVDAALIARYCQLNFK